MTVDTAESVGGTLVPAQSTAPAIECLNSSEPFRTDASWIKEYFPESRQFADYMLSPDNQLSSPLLNDTENGTGTVIVNRSIRRQALALYGEDERNVLSALTGLMLEYDGEEQAHRIADLLDPYLKNNVYAGQVISEYQRLVATTTPTLRYMRQLQQTVETKTKGLIRTPSDNYALIKTVTNAYFENSELLPEDESDNITALSCLLVGEAGVQRKTGPLYEGQKQLESHQLDGFIAEDVIKYAADTDLPDGHELKKLRALCQLMEACWSEHPREEVAKRLAQNQSLWPYELQKILDRSRDRFTQALSQAISVAERILIERGIVASDIDPQHLFDESMTRLTSHTHVIRVKETSDKPVIPQQFHRPDVHLAQVIHSVTARRRRREIAQQNQTANVERASESEVEREPLEIVRLDRKGNTHAQNGEHFKDFVEDFLKPYKGNTNVWTDIQRIFDWLSQQSFADGIRGTDKLTDNNTVLHKDAVLTAYRFKPLAVEGLSTKTKFADKLRMIIARTPDGKLAILDFYIRDQQKRALDSWGLAAGRAG